MVILNLKVLIVGRTSNVNTTTPTPPIKCVDDLQNRRPLGKSSILLSMVAPVVVKPETDSKNALGNVNSPPHIRYGSIPNIQDRNHANMVMAKPSDMLISSVLRTKIRGKSPTIRVVIPLIRRGVKDESIPFRIDITIERSINDPLKINVTPRYLDISLIFIVSS